MAMSFIFYTRTILSRFFSSYSITSLRYIFQPTSTSRNLFILTLLSVFPIFVQATNTRQPIAIVIHGGAGTILKSNMSADKEALYRSTLNTALERGYEKLKQGKDGTEAVVAVITYLEDSPLFNAGLGAVYTYDGKHELDASIMHGEHKNAGAVAGLTTVKNPITAAQLVMEKSVHVMLSGEGAESFTQLHNIEQVDNRYFDTEFRRNALDKAKQQLLKDEKSAAIGVSTDDIIAFQDYKFGTVGAVVLDASGNIVAGTSTGGMTAKRYGRVGDSPIIGAGTYADNNSCGVSATGHGEYFIRHNVAADICARVKYQNVSLKDAANSVIFKVLNDKAGSGGIIAIDSKGNISMPFNTAGMYRGSIDIHGNKTIAIYKDE